MSRSELRLPLALALPLLVIAATAVAYGNASLNGFLRWDDVDYVLGNSQIDQIDAASLAWMMSTLHLGNWHPLTWLSHAIDVAAFGRDAGMHHVVNVCLHSMNAVLVMILTERVLSMGTSSAGEPAGPPFSVLRLSVSSLLVAVLFAVHPQRVESVAWISERKDLLCATFSLISLILYLRYLEIRRLRYFVGASAGFLLAIMAKPMAVTLPVIFLLLDLFPGGRLTMSRSCHRPVTEPCSRAQVLLEKVPLLAVSAAIGAVTLLAQGEAGAIAGLEVVDASSRLANAANGYTLYLQKMVFPVDLLPLYAPAETSVGLDAKALISLGALCALTALTGALAVRGRPGMFVAFMCFGVSLLPVSGLVQAGVQSAADRYAYLTTLPFYVGLAWVLGRPRGSAVLAERYAVGPIAIGALVVCVAAAVALIFATRQQVRIWEHDGTLWSYTLSRTGNTGPAAYIVLADHLRDVWEETGDEAAARDALRLYVEAVNRFPRQTRTYPRLISFLEDRGDLQSALSISERTIALFGETTERLLRRGELALKAGRFDIAKQAFVEVERRADHTDRSLWGLASALAGLGENARAREVAERLRTDHPGSGYLTRLPASL